MEYLWCRKPGSNRYEGLSSRDFKSRASTCSAIPANDCSIILAYYRGFVKASAEFSRCSQGWRTLTIPKKSAIIYTASVLGRTALPMTHHMIG